MFPRCHYIRSEIDSEAFVEDYITTSLISTLKIIVRAIENNKMIFTENGNVSLNFIISVCLFKNNNIAFLIRYHMQLLISYYYVYLNFWISKKTVMQKQVCGSLRIKQNYGTNL